MPVLEVILNPSLFAAVATIVVPTFGYWLASEVRALKRESESQKIQIEALQTEREGDKKIIRVALRNIRDRIVHAQLVVSLLQVHAPDVTIPPEVILPDELKDDI